MIYSFAINICSGHSLLRQSALFSALQYHMEETRGC